MFISTIAFLSYDFVQTVNYINKIVDSLKFGENSYTVIDGISYCKYFITEVVLLKEDNYPHQNSSFDTTLEFIHHLMKELSVDQGKISTSYITWTSKIKYINNLSDYINSISFNTMTIINGETHIEYLSLNSAMEILSTDLFLLVLLEIILIKLL